jgi:hypothetical protein
MLGLLGLCSGLLLLLDANKLCVVPGLSDLPEHVDLLQLLRDEGALGSQGSALEGDDLMDSIMTGTSLLVFWVTAAFTASLLESGTTPFLTLPATRGERTRLATYD